MTSSPTFISALRQRSNVTKTQGGLKNGMRIKHKLMNRKNFHVYNIKSEIMI
jgi:hypothetical protein